MSAPLEYVRDEIRCATGAMVVSSDKLSHGFASDPARLDCIDAPDALPRGGTYTRAGGKMAFGFSFVVRDGWRSA